MSDPKLSDMLSEYTIKRNSKYGVSMIEFEEKDALKIRKTVFECKKGGESELSESDPVYAIGKDKKIYLIDENGIRMSDMFGSTGFGFLNKQYALYCNACKTAEKAARKVKKAQGKDAEIKLIPDFTLSNYKKFIFTDKFGNNVSCRIRLSKNKNRPILFYFHGGGHGGNDNQLALYEFNLARIGLIGKDCNVIVPQRPGSYKTEDELFESSKELIEYIADLAHADKNRVYILGGSAGGRCTWEFVWRNPDYVAAAISLCGECMQVADMNAEKLVRIKDVPLWIAHDETDDAVSIKLDDFCVEELRKLGSPVRYSRYNKYGHMIGRAFYFKEKWAAWMLDQSLEKR